MSDDETEVSRSGHKPYFNKKGDRIPGVTTIISRFKESGGLVHWAWDLGKQGIDYRDIRDKAADVGTVCHKMVECEIRRQKFNEREFEKDVVIAARSPFESFKKWAKLSKLRPSKTETRLVSERYQYGGKVDAVEIGKELCIIDWKTSNRVYPDYILQVAAYRALWNENFPKTPVTDGHLIRFGKGDDPSFAHHAFSESDLDDAFEAFVLERALYDRMKSVKARLGT